MRTLAVIIALSITAACSSSDETNTFVDARADVPYPLCGPTSNACCCNGGVAMHPVPCAEDGGPSCPAGSTYIRDECPVYCPPLRSDSSIEASPDASGDGGASD